MAARITPGPVVLAAGDIDGTNAERTAAILEAEPNATVLALGDNAYRCGKPGDYEAKYRPTWGKPSIMNRTWACPGNHEFQVCGTAGKGYYQFFEATHRDAWTAGTRDYYSFEIADCAWHFVSLNSEIRTSDGSPQLMWLRNDLHAHANQPTLVFFHRPRFSSGHHSSQGDLAALWTLLCEFRTEIVLTGHDHNYERFDQQDASQRPDAHGTMQFVVGTGGRSFDGFGSPQKNSAGKPVDLPGVLRLTLNAASFDWRFIAVNETSVDEQRNHPVNAR